MIFRTTRLVGSKSNLMIKLNYDKTNEKVTSLATLSSNFFNVILITSVTYGIAQNFSIIHAFRLLIAIEYTYL